MPEEQRPQVSLLGRADGETIILPMGGLQAHVTRKASRTETGGHWAFGEAWQDPNFDNPLTLTTKRRPSTSSRAATRSTRMLTRGGGRAGHIRLHPTGGGARVPDRFRGRPLALSVAVDRRSGLLRASVLDAAESAAHAHGHDARRGVVLFCARVVGRTWARLLRECPGNPTQRGRRSRRCARPSTCRAWQASSVLCRWSLATHLRLTAA